MAEYILSYDGYVPNEVIKTKRGTVYEDGVQRIQSGFSLSIGFNENLEEGFSNGLKTLVSCHGPKVLEDLTLRIINYEGLGPINANCIRKEEFEKIKRSFF